MTVKQSQPGQARDMVLRLIRSDGAVSERRVRKSAEEQGLILTGPDGGGRYTVRYTPTWQEVNRVGKTEVELVVSYADGSQNVHKKTIDTP